MIPADCQLLNQEHQFTVLIMDNETKATANLGTFNYPPRLKPVMPLPVKVCRTLEVDTDLFKNIKESLSAPQHLEGRVVLYPPLLEALQYHDELKFKGKMLRWYANIPFTFVHLWKRHVIPLSNGPAAVFENYVESFPTIIKHLKSFLHIFLPCYSVRPYDHFTRKEILFRAAYS
ncbi:Ran-specific GTPase-activating protein, partial [Frankliniella fusca]